MGHPGALQRISDWTSWMKSERLDVQAKPGSSISSFGQQGLSTRPSSSIPGPGMLEKSITITVLVSWIRST
jgi:hypothetical protein